MSEAHWEHLPHGADIGVRGIGKSKAEAFEQAAVALTAVITDVDSVSAETAIKIQCTASDDEMLLVERRIMYREPFLPSIAVSPSGQNHRGRSQPQFMVLSIVNNASGPASLRPVTIPIAEVSQLRRGLVQPRFIASA
jgi:hypothetical protein